MGPTDMTLCLEEICQVAVPDGRQTTTVFGWVCQNAAPGTKSATYNFLLCAMWQLCGTASFNAPHQLWASVI